MRLVNTASIKVETFNRNIPRYAILSHRWEEDEVLLEDIKAGGNAKGMKGYRKLRLSCAIAAREGHKYIWIDTCCIDKTSSAELSEAINSMFRYYKEAEVCYTYLSDVASVKIPSSITLSDRKSMWPDFYKSAWFERGWTLQELIAPKNLCFYNNEWDFLGTKADLKDAVGLITKIPENILLGGDLTNESVSRKMSWASSRQTTVPEDIAYCLLGLFGVNIPLLYGEGEENAFLRLQEAILKISDDNSIFLWSVTEEEAIKEPFWGLLAKSPTHFSRSPDIVVPCTLAMTTNTPATLTGRGLSVEFQMSRLIIDESDSIFSALIFVNKGKVAYGILMQKLSYSGVHFARVSADVLLEIDRRMDVDISRMPHRLLSFWAGNVLSSRNLLRRKLEEPKALRFYVRQNPKTSSVIANEVAGFFFDPRESLPGFASKMSLDDWSSRWDRWGMDGGQDSGAVYLEFETDYNSQNPIVLDRTPWRSELFGALQLSRQLNGALKQLTLLVGLETSLSNALNTSLTYTRPWYLLYDVSDLRPNPDQILKSVSSKGIEIIGFDDSDCELSFDVDHRYGQLYYLIKLRERENENTPSPAATMADAG